MGHYWPKYVPVAQRRAEAAKHLKKAKGKGLSLNPVAPEGRQIANTFWGKAWCDNLENYSDYENRLPRGRTYLRNGSVLDLQVTKGRVNAQVMGSFLYKITVEIKAMSVNKWKTLVKACAGKIDSLIELLQGKFSKGVMSMIVEKESGLFPKPSEISMQCTCPDHAGLCKHIAAVLYGIGTCLDTKPEWFFLLRHVDHLELVASASESGILTPSQPSANALDESNLSSLFGIEMAPTQSSQKQGSRPHMPKAVVEPSPPPKKASSATNGSVKLTLQQAALLLKISESQLNDLLVKRELPFHRLGRQRWIWFEDILKYRKNSCAKSQPVRTRQT
jgi:excisionase family DNA binding protein